MINNADASLIHPQFLNFIKSVHEGLTAKEIPYRDFFRQAWPLLNPGNPLIESFVIDLISEYLEAVDDGQIKRLIINIPPRFAKSSLVSVAWPVWSWSRMPWSKWIFSSSEKSLSVDFSIKRRNLIDSVWFQNQWGRIFSLSSDQNQKSWFENDQRGVMYTTSTGSGVIGRGGDRIVIDDPIDPLMIHSKVERTKCNTHFSQVLYTRLDNKKTGVIVIVMQRLHREDLSGYFMSRYTGYEHLMVQQKADRRTVITFPMSKKKLVRKEGDFISPERYSQKEFDDDRKVMGTRSHEAQHQQKTTNIEESLLPRSNWQYYRELPNVIRSVWSWDTAVKTGQQNDFTVGLKISECENGYYISRYFRGKIKYPQLRKQAEIDYNASPSEVVLVEDKSSGQQLIQDLQQDTRLPIIAFISDKDKVTRVSLISPIQEAKKIYLPLDAPWVADFVERCEEFPDVDFDDEIDTLSQGILYLSGKTATKKPGIRTF